MSDIVFESLRFLQQKNRMVLYAYVLMENHLHLIAFAENLSKEIHDFKSFSAHKIVECLEQEDSEFLLRQFHIHKLAHKKNRTYQVWQEGSHPQLINDHAMMREKIQYIHYNPVKRGHVDEPKHWRYSSARNYNGTKPVLEICMES